MAGRHAPPVDVVFAPMPVDAMLAEFQSKLLLPPAVLKALGGEAYTLAWSVARVSTFGVLNMLREALVEIVTTGGTVRDWHRSLSDVYLASGWATSKGHAVTIFRTTLATSYESERLRALTGNEFVELLMYDAIEDSRVRPEHLALDGKTWERTQFPAEYWPPNGYNCRCTVIPVDRDQVANLGGTLQQAGATPLDVNGRPIFPDEGFTAPPSASELSAQVLADLKQRLGKAGWGAVPPAVLIPKPPPPPPAPAVAVPAVTPPEVKIKGRTIPQALDALEKSVTKITAERAKLLVEIRASSALQTQLFNDACAAGTKAEADAIMAKMLEAGELERALAVKERKLGEKIKAEVLRILGAEKPCKARIGIPKLAGHIATKQKIKAGVAWWRKIVGPGWLDQRSVKVSSSLSTRACYTPSTVEIKFTAWSTSGTAAHELSHFLEHFGTGLHDEVMKFFDVRTAGETAVKLSTLLGSGYSAWEVTKVDKFPHAYVGKVYAPAMKASEVLSMALEMLHDDPLDLLMKDRGLIEFVLRLLRR